MLSAHDQRCATNYPSAIYCSILHVQDIPEVGVACGGCVIFMLFLPCSFPSCTHLLIPLITHLLIPLIYTSARSPHTHTCSFPSYTHLLIPLIHTPAHSSHTPLPSTAWVTLAPSPYMHFLLYQQFLISL